jgi:drug/metabolite transporter superfamily protein YnfA
MRPLAHVAWIAIVAAAVDLAGRQVARRSLWEATGLDVDATTVLVIASLAAIAGGVAAWQRARHHDAPKPTPIVLLVLAIAFVAGLFAQLQLGARSRATGSSTLVSRSLWFDGDVDLTNDYRLLGLSGPQHQLLYTPTPTGYAQSAWSIGPAVVWSPFFAAGHVVARSLHARGHEVAIDGTSYPYRQAICIAGLFYGLLGAWCCWRLACVFFPHGVAVAATFVTIAGSFMLWYLVKEPSMSHAPSMAAVAAFVWAWVATSGPVGRAGWLMRWRLLGLGAGLMMAIRWQNALFLLLPALELVAARRSGRVALKVGLLFAAATAVGFAPQMLAWLANLWTSAAVSPISPQVLWTDPHLVDVPVVVAPGLFALSPALYVAAIGLPSRSREPASRPGVDCDHAADDLSQCISRGLVGRRWGTADADSTA